MTIASSPNWHLQHHACINFTNMQQNTNIYKKNNISKASPQILRPRRTNLELLAVHGGDFRLLADGEGVGHSLPGGLGGDDKVVAALLDLGDGLDVLGHLDHVGRELCEK